MKKIIGVLVTILVITMIIILSLTFIKKTSTPFFVFESRTENTKKELEKNPSTVGWVKVQGTDIDYPIVKDANYLNTPTEIIDRIWLSKYYEKSANRMVIYGHNYLNVGRKPLITNKTHKRFEQLMSFVYYSFAKDNLYIQYSYDDEDEIYKIYAISFYDYDEDIGQSYYDKKEITEYINTAKKKSIYDYDVDVNGDDKIITLMTCTRYFGDTSKQQFRIDARKLRKKEKIEKYSVKKSENYDIMN